MTNLRLLKQLLNCNNLTDDRNLSCYGITNKRSNVLTNPKNGRNSFFNPRSETALTLFLLGNVDDWKQIGTLKTAPRDKEDKWSKTFFDNIRVPQDNYDTLPSIDALWAHNKEWKEKTFVCRADDLQKSTLLFEFEMINSAFHSVRDRAFKELSFLNIKRKWSKFDAVLIVPGEKLFVFFESKFTSDISQTTKNYTYINQIMRNLESAFLLTNHQDSRYKDWKFKYVMICPRKTIQYKLTYYTYVLDAIEEHISLYKEIIEKEYKSSINKGCYSKYFELFTRQIPDCIYKIYWDDLGKVLKDKDKNFFRDYFNRLKEAGLEQEDIENIKKRFSAVSERGLKKLLRPFLGFVSTLLRLFVIP